MPVKFIQVIRNVFRICVVFTSITLSRCSSSPVVTFPSCRQPSRSVSTSLTCMLAARPARRGNRRKKDMASLGVEAELRNRNYRYIIGSDESGRGCIAGPVVVVSCCILPELLPEPITGVDDSKKLSVEDRERIYELVVNQPDVYGWNVAICPNTKIDESDILKATMACFSESIEGLVVKLDMDVDEAYSIVDGKKNAKLTGRAKGLSCRPWVKADEEVYTVALASVIAKVTRDQIMTNEAHSLYPAYGFDKNKGYATKDHVIAVHTHGPCPIHRMSFKALKNR